MRPRTAPAALAAALLLLAAAAGCEDKAARKSTSKHLLALQHRFWRQSRETLRTEQPNLGPVMAVAGMVGERTRLRIVRDYTAANKDEVLAALDAISAAYQAEVLSKLETGPHTARLKAGVTVAQLRAAFDKIDKDYRKFEAMTTP